MALVDERTSALHRRGPVSWDGWMDGQVLLQAKEGDSDERGLTGTREPRTMHPGAINPFVQTCFIPLAHIPPLPLSFPLCWAPVCLSSTASVRVCAPLPSIVHTLAPTTLLSRHGPAPAVARKHNETMQVPGDDPALDAETQAPLLLGIAYGMLAPALAVVALRLYTRFVILKAPGVDDALITVAVVGFRWEDRPAEYTDLLTEPLPVVFCRLFRLGCTS